jgi:glycogen debranching enzyme
MNSSSEEIRNMEAPEEISHEESLHRQKRLLAEGTSSITRSIDNAVVIKNRNLFFLTTPEGHVPLKGSHGFGLYFNDCRYLSGYQVRLAGERLNTLGANDFRGYYAVFSMTNPEIALGEALHIPLDEIGIKWQRLVDGQQQVMLEEIDITNFGFHHLNVPLTLEFRASFEDVFAIRGLLPLLPGEVHLPEWRDGRLVFGYDGKDRLYRELDISFTPEPDRMEGTLTSFQLRLEPRQNFQLKLAFRIREVHQENKNQPGRAGELNMDTAMQPARDRLEREIEAWAQGATRVSSTSLLLNRVMERSLRDLWVLESEIENFSYFAAGIPWYATLFGRDTLITALQTLAINPDLAASTLRVLAYFQGREVDDRRDEQPGKILHELRVGELAHLGEIPHTPYYGTVDATPLFLILVARHAQWTGSLDLFHELEQNVEMALNWIDEYGDLDGDGYVEYESRQERGLINKGWKDSGDSIVNSDGSLAETPIALVEVQAYIYEAKTSIANLYELTGEPDKAVRLRSEAEDLKKRFDRDFWVEELGTYALALHAGNRPAAVLSSNAGHALWAGIAQEAKAGKTVERLMSPDMFNYWGIRTLSSKERRYNPLGYHLGTVWPHDNSMIAAGFRRYGFDQAAGELFTGMVDAAISFPGYRLPELFSGLRQADFSSPVHYPVACHPQAWAAATLLYFVEINLGLKPDAFNHQLHIIRPILPEFAGTLTLRGLRIGSSRVDLQFEPNPEDGVKVNVLNISGPLEVIVKG